MALNVSRLRLVPRLVLALSILVSGLVTMKPVPASAQSVLERIFGAPAFQTRREMRGNAPKRTQQKTVVRKKVIRKKAVRTAPKRSRSVARSSDSSAKRSASKASTHTYRTLCVRKADGYFFPVSFSTTTQYFDQDLVACQARCPGTDVDLYFHRVLREEAEDMVSHTSGDNYTDLSTAFAYKTMGLDKSAVKACEIRPEPVIEASLDLGDLPFESAIPMPVWRPDGEAILVSDLRGGSADVAEVSNRQKIIRRVGPQFFPDQ